MSSRSEAAQCSKGYRAVGDRPSPAQRSDQRRSAILESLDHHLKELGFEAVNIADVAGRAGVRSAFYFYFDTERAAGRAPDGPDAELLAAMLLEFNDRLMERLTLGGTLSLEQRIEGAEAIWMRTIYGTTAAVDQMPATL